MSHLETIQLCLGNLDEGFDWEEVVVGSGEVGRGDEGQATDVAAAGQIHHPGLAPGTPNSFIKQLARTITRSSCRVTLIRAQLLWEDTDVPAHHGILCASRAVHDLTAAKMDGTMTGEACSTHAASPGAGEAASR